MANTQNRGIGRLSLLGATLIWGSSFIILKSTLDSVPTLWVLALRFTGAALLMALIGIKELHLLDRQYLLKGLGLGTALFAAYTLQTFGLEYTTPGKNAFLTATYCVIVPFMWWFFTKKRPDRFNIAAALVCIIGMALVSLDGGLSLGLGDALTICCGFFYALHIILTARAVEGRSPVLLSMVQFAVAAVWCWVTAPLVSPFPQGVPASAWWSIFRHFASASRIMASQVCWAARRFSLAPPSSARYSSSFSTRTRILLFSVALSLYSVL